MSPPTSPSRRLDEGSDLLQSSSADSPTRSQQDDEERRLEEMLQQAERLAQQMRNEALSIASGSITDDSTSPARNTTRKEEEMDWTPPRPTRVTQTSNDPIKAALEMQRAVEQALASTSLLASHLDDDEEEDKSFLPPVVSPFTPTEHPTASPLGSPPRAQDADGHSCMTDDPSLTHLVSVASSPLRQSGKGTEAVVDTATKSFTDESDAVSWHKVDMVQQDDDDYVPIADYSSPPRTKPRTNKPNVYVENGIEYERLELEIDKEADDYVPIVDYSPQKTTKADSTMGKTLLLSTRRLFGGRPVEPLMSATARRRMLLRQRRRRRRNIRRVIVLLVVAAVGTYYYRKSSSNNDTQGPMSVPQTILNEVVPETNRASPPEPEPLEANKVSNEGMIAPNSLEEDLAVVDGTDPEENDSANDLKGADDAVGEYEGDAEEPQISVSFKTSDLEDPNPAVNKDEHATEGVKEKRERKKLDAEAPACKAKTRRMKVNAVIKELLDGMLQ